ncbi:MAG: efflux RND transporter periplasmic adaptor subunit [Deltaproteobacteria bacterium]|nr:efflux RND transporter periplasmic adaptor subunit [Deltaproteobacteria bacterium]
MKSFFDRLFIKILLLVFIWVAITACKEKIEIVEQVRSLKTITVSELATGKIRKFSGIVRATDSSNMSFEVSGRVEIVNVDIGDRVRKGQLLAVIDKEPYRLDVDAARAELVKAEAKVVNTKEEYDRQERVYQQGAGAKSKLDRAKYNWDAARSQVNYQIAKLNLAKRDLRKTMLTSPYDGHIAWRSVDPHEEIKVGQKVFAIDAKGALEVHLAVPETTIHRVHIGTPTTIRFPTLPEHSVKGRISFIGSAAVKANAFPVKVGLIEPPANINPGMTAEASLLLKDDSQIAGYRVPIQAILPAKEIRQGYAFVYDPETSTVGKTLIQTLGAEQNMTIVSEGLSAGDVIAVAGVSFLADGMKVKLMEQ